MKKILQYFVAILTFATLNMYGSSGTYSLINNYTSDATSCTFYYSNSPSVKVGTIAGNGGSFAGISSTNYAIQCNYSALGQTGMIIPIIPTSNVNMFGYGGSVYNNSNAPIYVWYQGTVKYPTAGNQSVYLTANNPMTIAPGSAVPIITGTTQITGYSSNSNPSITSMTALFTISNASATNTYYIDANYQYSTSVAMTNNYNTSASVSVNSTAAGSIAAAGSYTIPSGTSTLQAAFSSSNYVNFNSGFINFNNNFNIFSNYEIVNNTSSILNVSFYASNNQTTPVGYWQLYSGQNILIPTGITGLSAQFTQGGTAFSYQSIPAGANYSITDNNGWQVNSYQPVYYNNGTQPATNLNFYDQTNAFIAPTITPFNVGSVNLPGNASLVQMYNADLNSSLSLPVAFGYPAIFTQNGQGQLYTIANTTDSTIYINYFGTINNANNQPFNQTPITVESGAYTYILIGALNISITSQSGSTPITQESFPNGTGSNYYVYDTGTELMLLATNTQQLTNNYSQSTGNITFTGGTTTTISGLQPWQSTATIPTETTTAQFTQIFNGQSATLTIPISDTVSSNIFENYCLYNSCSFPIFVTFYSDSITQLNTPTITVPANNAIPIINNNGSSTLVAISSQSQGSLAQTSLSTSQSYQVTPGSGVLNITDYIPTLTNNYSGQNATNFQFLQSNGSVITTNPATPSTFESGATMPVPATSTAMNFSDYNGTSLTVPTFLSPTSNLFLPTTLTNAANQTVNVDFFGPITYQNYNNTQAQFNTTTMALGANNWIYLPTGTTSISATTPNNGSLTSAVTNITGANSFFINQETIADQLTIDTTVDLSTTSLTNNLTIPASQTANQLIFYNSSNNPLPINQTSITPTATCQIPNTAYYATFQQTFTADNSPVTTTLAIPAYLNNLPQYLYTPYTINNFTTETIYLTFYTTVQLNTQAIPVAAGTSLQILTGAQYVSITANGMTSISQQSLLTNSSTVSSSWYVTTSGSQLVLQTNIPATQYTLTNNYNYINQSAGVTFYDINSNNIGTASIDSFASTPIIDTTATIKLNDLGTTQIVLPVSDSESSALFSNAFINNSTGQSIGISYWYTANSQQVPCNTTSNLINLANNNSSPIFAQATQFAAYNSSGVSQVTQAIQQNTSYVVNNDWSITPISTGIALTNNTGQTANSVSFYDTGYPVGNVTSPANGTQTPIPAGATKANFQNLNQQSQSVTFSIPIIDSNSSIIVETDSSNNPYTITNNSGQLIYINYFGTLDNVPSSSMNTIPLPVSPGTSINILNGVSQSVTVMDNTSTPVISLAPISTGNNYYIYLEDGDWIMTNYTSTNTITNNGTAAATGVQCMPSTGSTPLTTIASLPSNQPFPIPTNTAYVTLYDANLASNLLLPIAGTANSTILAPSSFITNNSASSTIHLTYQGTVNNGISGLQNLNDTQIAVAPTETTQIVYGAQYVILQENSTSYQIQPGVAYYFDEIDGTWSLNTYSSSALLFNNFNTPLSSVTFNNSSVASQSVAANGSVAVPNLSTLITFTDFGTSTTTPPGTVFTVPVSATQSSSLFSSSVLTNTSNLDVQILAFGAGGTPLNTTGATLPGTAPNNYVNIFNALESFQVWYGGNLEIDTATISGLYPLPLTQSYDIVYNNSWSLVPTTTGTLFNNYNENAISITYYDSGGGTVPSISNTMLPWATNAAPATAYYAQIQYQSGTLTTILNPATASATVTGKVFTNSLLINNSDVDVYVTFYGTIPTTQSNSSQIQLNNTPILLEAGNAFPFINGTNAITLNNVSGQPILSQYPINSNQFWEIGYSLTTRSWSIEEKSALRAAASSINQSSSALGVLRFLGGQAPATSTTPSVVLYGKNAQLFEQYLYINTYAQCITDQVAQAAAKDQVHAIVYNYAINYRQQPNFNYISYFYLIQDQLDAAQTDLTAQYTSSTTQINQFFDYLKLRVAALL